MTGKEWIALVGLTADHPLWETLRRWRWLLYAAVAVALAAGFDFKSPRAQFAALQAADSAHHAQLTLFMDSMAAVHGELEQRGLRTTTLLAALARGQCLDRPRRELALMGLPCDSLLARGPR